MASSSSHQPNVERRAFSAIEPHGRIKRNVSESSKLFDVFISHRGPDVKQTVARLVYKSLHKLGIRAFLDSEEKKLGDSFPYTIETAIHSASAHIAIFSKRYAESPWCLAELVLMLQSKAKIFPVFYEVEPWELRHIEKGVYADSFIKYEKKGRYLDKLQEWKEALQSVSFLIGEELNSSSDCKNIVSAVQKEVESLKSKLYVAKHPVGLHKLVQDFERRCLDELIQDFESQCRMQDEREGRAQIVGIFGIGGVGKTTLSKELFNRKHSQYSQKCFLFDVREASSKGELPLLQFKLLKDIFDQNPPNFHSSKEGTSYMSNCIKRSRDLSFLIVLDDIDHVEQLEALLIMDMLKKSDNSLVIITTRDVGVLLSSGINAGYRVKGMDRNDGRELFCWHAFGQPHPFEGYEDLVKAFLDVCVGLPLSLQVLGRHVHGRVQHYWQLELNKVCKALPRDIKKVLEISFNALDDEERQIFMDIACFFIDKSKSMAIKIWEATGWSAQHALETLKNKCLVEEIEDRIWKAGEWRKEEVLRMHDHLRDMGREMANEMNSPRRLWHHQDLKSLELKGFQTILAESSGRCFQSILDKSMDARITYFLGHQNDGGQTSASLLWLDLSYRTHKIRPSIPSWIPLQNLQCLKIKLGNFKRLWESDLQAPSSLKELQIFGTFFEELPSLLGMLNHLENVALDVGGMTTEGWSFLESIIIIVNPISMVVSPFQQLTYNIKRGESATFKSLSLSVCLSDFRLKGMLALNNSGQCPTVKFPRSSLEQLEISDQNLVTKVLISGQHYPNLKSLRLSYMKELRCLELNGCKNLSLVELTCVKYLIELDLRMLTKLSRLHLSDCERLKSVSGISDLTNLKFLFVDRCPQLELPSCLDHLHSLKTITMINSLWKPVVMNIGQRPELEELSLAHLSCLKLSLSHPSYLKRLAIENCRKLKRVSGISNLTRLVELYISQCPELGPKLCIACLNSPERITVDRCEKLVYLLLKGRKLKCLELNGCKHLNIISLMEGFQELSIVNIRDCPELERLSIPIIIFWERITIAGFRYLNSLAEFFLPGVYFLPDLRIARVEIGRAVYEAESALNRHLFSDVIGADAVTEMNIPFHDLSPADSLSASIVCCVVVVDGYTIYNNYGEKLPLSQGTWMFTLVITNPKEQRRIRTAAIVKRGFVVTVKEDEEMKTLHVLETIVDRLYEKEKPDNGYR